MIAVARTAVPAAGRRRATMVVAVIAVTVVTTVVTVAVVDGADADGGVTGVIPVAVIVVAATRLDDGGGGLGAVIRVAAGPVTDIAVSRVVVTTGERQACRECQKQGMRTTHGFSLIRVSVIDDSNTAPARLNGR
jgi:hypothetical protein